MFCSLKEKSWSVLLIKGYVCNDQVRAERCENCKSTTEALTTNHHNPNLLLYGCRDSKCRHRLLRLDFDDEVSASFIQVSPQIASEPAVCEMLAPKIPS
jgi:hypothetical protein